MRITIHDDLAGKAKHYLDNLAWSQRIDWVLLNEGQIVEIGTKDERLKTRLDTEGFPIATELEKEAAKRWHENNKVPF